MSSNEKVKTNNNNQKTNLNNYCRNCGYKLENNENICPKCNLKVSENRIRTDKKYQIGLLANLLLIGLGLLFSFNNRTNPLSIISYIASYVIITEVYISYKHVSSVYIIYWLENIVLIGCILFVIFTFVSCINSCNNWGGLG